MDQLTLNFSPANQRLQNFYRRPNFKRLRCPPKNVDRLLRERANLRLFWQFFANMMRCPMMIQMLMRCLAWRAQIFASVSIISADHPFSQQESQLNLILTLINNVFVCPRLNLLVILIIILTLTNLNLILTSWILPLFAKLLSRRQQAKPCSSIIFLSNTAKSLALIFCVVANHWLITSA